MMQGYQCIQWQVFHTLGKFLQKTSLEHITIKELCQECHISRQTFYKYFQDKYEVINWHFDLLADNSLKQIGRTLNWRTAYSKLLWGLYNAKDVYTKDIYTDDYNSIKNHAARYSRELFMDTLTAYLKIAPTNLLLFQLSTLALTFTELIFNWAKNGMKESPEDYVDMLTTLLPQDLKYTFESPSPLLQPNV